MSCRKQKPRDNHNPAKSGPPMLGKHLVASGRRVIEVAGVFVAVQRAPIYHRRPSDYRAGIRIFAGFEEYVLGIRRCEQEAERLCR